MFNVFSHPDIDRNELKNPQDGGRVMLTGAWSEPSQPITIASPTRLFLTGTSLTGDTATVEVFRFLQGLWYSETVHVGPGDAIGDLKPGDARTGRPEIDFRTGYTIVDIGVDPAAVVETDTSGDGLKLRKSTSAILVYMDNDGSLHQRWASRDRLCQIKKELEYKVKMTRDQQAAAVPGLGGTAAPGLPGARPYISRTAAVRSR